MRFKPFTKKYDFSKVSLTEDYPSYLHAPLGQWVYDLVENNDLGTNRHGYVSSGITDLKRSFVNRLNTLFRQTFPTDLNAFMVKILYEPELTSNFLALMLQNYCSGRDAVRLEIILADGGSAFAVEKSDKTADEYETGVYDLVKRVSTEVRKQAESALSTSELIRDAWAACYSRNPDHAKTVTMCCDALEHLLRDKYEPKNMKPQLGLLVKNLRANPGKLSYKGDTLLENKFDLIALINAATSVRGSHTAGTGRNPTPDEAEYVLQATIFIWNLHHGI